MSRERWMAACFALGSSCFLIGPFPGYVQLVGASADAITFFVGSIFFTAGGGLQSWLAWSGRRTPGGGPAWWAAIVQSAGTLFFNVTTYEAMHTALTRRRRTGTRRSARPASLPARSTRSRSRAARRLRRLLDQVALHEGEEQAERRQDNEDRDAEHDQQDLERLARGRRVGDGEARR